MALTLSERETIIVFDEQHDTAEVFTYNARLSRRLRELCKQRPSDAQLTKDNSSGGLTFHCPKAWIRINPTRESKPLTDEQKAKMRERMSEINKVRLAYTVSTSSGTE